MRWIITFLLTILAQPFSQSGGQRSLILLDDPGIHLHPEAEKLLYRAFYYVVTEAQVIYTTHSPALVDQQEPDHLRIAKHIDEDETRGTTVTNDIREARDDDSQIDVLSTAREALGWTLDDFLFHGESTILVEGPSDKQYLQLFNQSFSFTEEKSFIDGDPTFIDSGGDKVTFLSRILEAEDVNHVILRDDDKAGEEHDRRIEERSIYYKDIFDGSHEQDYDVEVEDLINSRLIITCAAEQHPDHLDTRSLLEDYNEDRPIIDFIDLRLPDEIEVDKGELSRAVIFELREDIRESIGEYEETTERFHLVISRLADEFNT